MGDRRISCKCNRNVLSTLECTSDDGTDIETTGEGPGLREKNMVRILVGVMKADKRKWMKREWRLK